ncbi:DUF1713 domain-containing protein [Teratosphaeria destructans]|uniref:Small ribosomal subunit protein mS38 n=1 Tax=Teratosphaeria destructans TaxID=418781 RepID=A0A9W7W0Q7_9PEZI|nr:DUF1713 domain-containing protein [Teratosphaeria destructans]
MYGGRDRGLLLYVGTAYANAVVGQSSLSCPGHAIVLAIHKRDSRQAHCLPTPSSAQQPHFAVYTYTHSWTHDMFSSKLCYRVANRATASTAAAAASHPPAAAAFTTATTCLATRQPHQRRPSSSKASCPPNDSSKPAAPAKAAEPASVVSRPSGGQRKAKKTKSSWSRVERLVDERINGRREEAFGKGRGLVEVDQFASLPRVADLQNMTEADASVSRFFSQHRPMAVNSLIPPATTPESFSEIFDGKSTDPWANGNSADRRPEDVVYTLATFAQALDDAAGVADEGLRWEHIQDGQDGVRHLDGAPRRKTIEELVSQFKPFAAPPPPQPFSEEKKSSHASEKKKATSAKPTRTTPKQRKYQTVIEVTESTSATGVTTYSASSSPIIRLSDTEEPDLFTQNPVPTDTTLTRIETPSIQQPFLERMSRRGKLYTQAHRERVGEQRYKMILISVKRQRKLKMKKHKYKKLMKRTRNLRRKLDRA